MFERFTERARRAIFFARYEAGQFSNSYIETEHLLLGILREDKTLANRVIRTYADIEAIRERIKSRTSTRENVSQSTDIPLTSECKRALVLGVEEAERLHSETIGTEHLLVGLFLEEKSFAAEILRELGFQRPETSEPSGG